MPELVLNGHLYIAQPPLYKVKTRKGRKEQYLKDDEALDAFLVSQALRSAVVTVGSGDDLEGDALQPRIELARRYVTRLDGLRRRMVPEVLDAWMSMQGHLVDFSDESAVREASEALRARLGEIAPDLHITDIALVFDEERFAIEVRTLRDGEERVTSLKAGEPGRACVASWANCMRQCPFRPTRGPEGSPSRLAHLARYALQRCAQGLRDPALQGAGRDEPGQVWETAMDPTRHSLVQVQVGEQGTTDHIFSVLMGDAVDPRRNFIQQNALNVRNLDV